MSKKIIIPRLSTNDTNIATISSLLDSGEIKEVVDQVNWSDFPYQPEVSFVMAYSEKNLYLKFYVKENHIRAMVTATNGNVWEDSCCEFFCSFDREGYYNIETNCIGTQLIGWGKGRDKRIRLSEKIINVVEKSSTLEQKVIEPQSGSFVYQLTMIIPASTFTAHPGLKFNPGMQFTGNFYKCGDKTPEPHFVSWSRIAIEKPDFHRPDFFATLELE